MKNTFKAITIGVALIGAISVAGAITYPSSGTVTISNTDYDGGSNPGLQGGEFGADITGYDRFYTFCIEYSQYMDLGSTYSYSLSLAADSTNNTISKGTAYLFAKFAKGSLYARSLDGDTGTHDQNAGYLQKAVWYLEDNVGPNYSDIGSNPFVTMVTGIYGTLEAAKADASVDMGVRVMNLTIGETSYQDVLIYVPDSGTTLGLLGFCLTVLAIVRRRTS